MNIHSRIHEFQADAYSVSLGFAKDLKKGLLKLHISNLGNTNPDSWYSVWYFSHPPLIERLSAIDEEEKKYLVKVNGNENLNSVRDQVHALNGKKLSSVKGKRTKTMKMDHGDEVEEMEEKEGLVVPEKKTKVKRGKSAGRKISLKEELSNGTEKEAGTEVGSPGIVLVEEEEVDPVITKKPTRRRKKASVS